jgi:hypothetical protein
MQKSKEAFAWTVGALAISASVFAVGHLQVLSAPSKASALLAPATAPDLEWQQPAVIDQASPSSDRLCGCASAKSAISWRTGPDRRTTGPTRRSGCGGSCTSTGRGGLAQSRGNPGRKTRSNMADTKACRSRSGCHRTGSQKDGF